jgi:hypothetical protein
MSITEASEIQPAEQRRSERRSVRSPVMLFCECAFGWQVVRGWTDDISDVGLYVRTERELREDDVYVRMSIAGLTDKVFTARVVRHDYGADIRAIYSYGLAITGICSEEKAAQVISHQPPA